MAVKDTRDPLMSIVALTLLLAAATGCASKRIWVSTPLIRTFEAEHYVISLEPVWCSKYHPYCLGKRFVAFNLKIENKSDRPLSISWENTLYISPGDAPNSVSGGVASGWFYFPEDIHDESDWAKIDRPKPPDIVLANSTYKTRISPCKLVRVDWEDNGENYHYSGTMPAGENGVYLVLGIGGSTTSKILTLSLSEHSSE